MLSHLLYVDISPLQIALIVSIPFLFIIFAIFRILKKETGIERILWIAVVLFFPFLGAVIYFIMKYLDREKRKSLETREPIDRLEQ